MTPAGSPLSAAEVEQRRQANRRHGLQTGYAKGEADEASLAPTERSRLAELRLELASPEGVVDALRERAARAVLIAEWGESWLRQKAETSGPAAAFTSPMLARFFTALAEARRALETLHRLGGPGDRGFDDEVARIRKAVHVDGKEPDGEVETPS